VRALNRLSARAVETLGPGKYADGGGLWLHKREDGGGQWVFRFTIHGRRREMGLGSIGSVSLREARTEAERWRAVSLVPEKTRSSSGRPRGGRKGKTFIC